MKNLLILFVVFSSMSAWAQDLGVGFMVGAPTVVSAKKLLNDGHAVDAGLGWSFGSKTRMHLHGDYLLSNKGALYWDEYPLDFYYGLGARMKFGDDIEFGARIPVGLSYMDQSKPFEVFGELAPILDLVPKTDVELSLVVGVRFYF
jgi:hypothetical protein